MLATVFDFPLSSCWGSAVAALSASRQSPANFRYCRARPSIALIFLFRCSPRLRILEWILYTQFTLEMFRRGFVASYTNKLWKKNPSMLLRGLLRAYKHSEAKQVLLLKLQSRIPMRIACRPSLYFHHRVNDGIAQCTAYSSGRSNQVQVLDMSMVATLGITVCQCWIG